VLEHSQPKTKPLDEVKVAIADTIKQQRMQEEAERYLAELKSKAKIVYADGMAPVAKK
jgi:parvulin-like peptidyl-prolyl isomerase